MARLGLALALALLLCLAVAADAARPARLSCGPCSYVREWTSRAEARAQRAQALWPHRGGTWPSYAR